jgi:ACS family tartrate transporter-like MFS transporter
LFEVPSNIILVRVGARRWISRIAITWGIVSCAMLLAGGPYSFYALRFLLGVAEAGYFPGIIFYLRRWFPERRRARAVSRFMIGIPIASIVGAPVGGLLLGLDGHLGLTGWQWLFLIEGLPAVIFGIVALGMLTERPADATWLSRDEKAWLENELAGEASRSALRERGVLETLKNPTVWLLALVYLLALLAMIGVNFWAPTVVKELLHLTNQQVGGVTGVIGLVGLAGMLTNGWHSDRTGERLGHAAIPVLLAMTGLILAGTSRANSRRRGVGLGHGLPQHDHARILVSALIAPARRRSRRRHRAHQLRWNVRRVHRAECRRQPEERDRQLRRGVLHAGPAGPRFRDAHGLAGLHPCLRTAAAVP